MGREVEYLTDTTKRHHAQFRGYSRVITVLWVIFSVCFAVLNIVAFIQPQWLGDTPESHGVGFFGLYERCERMQIGGDIGCTGDFLNFKSILNDSFRASSILVGLSALLFIISIVCMLFFFFLKAATVLRVCGWMQLIASFCITVGCIVFPSGWYDPEVRRICGNEADKYNPGRCMIRWSYILAIVLIFDGFVLAILAFCLASRQANLLPKNTEKKSFH